SIPSSARACPAPGVGLAQLLPLLRLRVLALRLRPAVGRQSRADLPGVPADAEGRELQHGGAEGRAREEDGDVEGPASAVKDAGRARLRMRPPRASSSGRDDTSMTLVSARPIPAGAASGSLDARATSVEEFLGEAMWHANERDARLATGSETRLFGSR